MKKRKLTPKQKAFADYYIETGNAEESAIKAGYSEGYARGNAHKLVANSCIKRYIDERMKKIASERIIEAQEALEILTSIARGEATEQVVTPSGKVITRSASIDQRQKAIDSLLKRYNVIASLKKTEAETELIKEKIRMLKGASKDTSLMEALIDVVNSND